MSKLFPVILTTLFLFTSCQESFDKRLLRETKEFTKSQCPMQVEEGCILDSISYNVNQRVYTWWYQLSDVGVAAFSENRPLLHKILVDHLSNDVELKSLKDNKVTFQYIYRSSSSGRTIYETTITQDEYLRH